MTSSAEAVLDSDLLDFKISKTRRARLASFDEHLLLSSGSNVATLAPSVLHHINCLYEEGTITRLQRAKIKAHILRQSDPEQIAAVESHYRRRSLNLAAHVITKTPETSSESNNDSTVQKFDLETVLLALEDSAVASPVHLYDEDDVVLLMGTLYKRRRTGIKAGKYDKRYVILTEKCLRYYEDKKIFNGKTSVKWKRKYLPERGMFVKYTSGPDVTSGNSNGSKVNAEGNNVNVGGNHNVVDTSNNDESNILFSLVTSQEVLSFRAKDKDECNKWIMVLSDWLMMNAVDRDDRIAPTRSNLQKATNTESSSSSLRTDSKSHASTSSTIMNPAITMSGVLFKYEGMRGFRSFKPYLFTLQRHVLFYSDVDNNNITRGYIVLNEKYTLNVKSRTSTIILTGGNGIAHTIKAKSAKFCNEWVEVLTDTIIQIGREWFREKKSLQGGENEDEKNEKNDSFDINSESRRLRVRKSKSFRLDQSSSSRPFGLTLNQVRAGVKGGSTSNGGSPKRPKGLESDDDDDNNNNNNNNNGHRSFSHKRVSKVLISDTSKFEQQFMAKHSSMIGARKSSKNVKLTVSKTDSEIKLLLKSVKRVAQNAAFSDSVSGRLFIHIDDSALKKLVGQMSLINVSPYENVYEKGEKGMLLFVVGSGTFEVNGEEDGIANYVHEEQKVGDKRVSNFSRGSVVALNSGYDGSEGSVSSEISNSSNNNITATSSGNIDIAETRNRSGRAKSILDRPPTSTTNTNTTAGKRPKSDRWDSIQRSRGASVLRARRSSETMISGASHHSRNSSFMSSDLSVFSISERSSDMTASSRNSNLHGWSSLQATKLIENGVVRNCGNNRPTSTLLLSQGDCFGQEALFHEAVRTMTVSATKQGGTLWAVQKNVFHHIAVQAHMRAMHDVRRLLRRVRLFRENALTSDDIESLCELAEIHKLSKGYVLSESGYDLDFFLLVRKGKIELSHEEEDAPKDTMNHSMIMKRGNYIGLGCLLPPLNVKRPSIDSKTSVGYENRTKIEVKSNHSVCVLLSHSDFIRVIGHERYVQLKRSTGKSFFDQNFDERDRSCSVSSLNCGESPERRKSKKKQKFESQLNLRTPSNPSINGSKSLKIKKHSNMTSSTRKEKEFNRSLSVGDNSHRPAPPSPRLSTRRHNKGIESSDSIDMGGLRACDPALLIPVALEDSIVASEQCAPVRVSRLSVNSGVHSNIPSRSFNYGDDGDNSGVLDKNFSDLRRLESLDEVEDVSGVELKQMESTTEQEEQGEQKEGGVIMQEKQETQVEEDEEDEDVEEENDSYDPMYPWRKVLTDDHEAYWWNEETDETTWYRPVSKETSENAPPEEISLMEVNDFMKTASEEVDEEGEGGGEEEEEEEEEQQHQEGELQEEEEQQDEREEEDDDDDGNDNSYFSDSDENSEEDYENHDLDWTSGLSVLSPEIDFHSIEVCTLLGCGAFSSVKLVRTPVTTTSRSGLILDGYEYFAVKMMAISYIVDNGWEQMVEQERLAMIEISKSSPYGNGTGDYEENLQQNEQQKADDTSTRRFTLGLHQSFYDSYMIYLLIDFCSGGELYDYCQTKKDHCLNVNETTFYSACVVLGLTELHNINIVYRDLKLENLIINRNGYVIVADFGLAKKSTRTYTVCGTPEYMSPELVLSTGHDRTADLWSLGILIFEMTCGATPFSGGSPMETYENIVQFNDHRPNGGGSHRGSHRNSGIDSSSSNTNNNDTLPWHITSNNISNDTKLIINGLLQKSKRLRLGSNKSFGINAIKNHKFFNSINWDDMINRNNNITVPYVPEEFNVNDFKDQIKSLAEDVKSQHENGSGRGNYWKPEGFLKVTN